MNEIITNTLLKFKKKKFNNPYLDLRILLREASSKKKDIILSNLNIKDIDIKYFNLLGFKDFFISSDSKKILKYAQRFGGYPILRPKFLATDKSNELLSWKHAINLLNKTNNFV